MELKSVRYEVAEHVGTITLDRPQRLNAWTGRMHHEYRWCLEQAGITPASASVTRIPQNTVDLDAEAARKVLALIDALDDHDDVQGVSANFDVSAEVLAEIGS